MAVWLSALHSGHPLLTGRFLALISVTQARIFWGEQEYNKTYYVVTKCWDWIPNPIGHDSEFLFSLLISLLDLFWLFTYIFQCSKCTCWSFPMKILKCIFPSQDVITIWRNNDKPELLIFSPSWYIIPIQKLNHTYPPNNNNNNNNMMMMMIG
jgi:hypothetical protein